MKASGLFEGPYLIDGPMKPFVKADATPSLHTLKRLDDYLGRLSSLSNGHKLEYDFWMSKTKKVATITTTDEPKIHPEFDDFQAYADDSKHLVVASARFQPPPAELLVKNPLQISKISTHDDHQRLFLMGGLYILLANYGYTIISDFTQFDGGKGLWKSLASRSKLLKYSVQIWDDTTDDWIKDSSGKPLHYTANNIDDAKIWHDIETRYGKPTTLLTLQRK